MLLELHEFLDLKRLRHDAKTLARAEGIKLHRAHDRVAKQALRDHMVSQGGWLDAHIEHETSDYGWRELMQRTWKLDDDRILRRNIVTKAMPGGLLVEIEAPLFGQDGLRAFQHYRENVDVQRFSQFLSGSNELRYRVYQYEMGNGVRQRLLINRRMACCDGLLVCGGAEGHGHAQHERCCGRIEIGGLSVGQRDGYERALRQDSYAAMARWLVAIFGEDASAPHHHVGNGPAWLYGNAEISRRMREWIEADR